MALADDRETQEPDVPHRGLNVVDFQSPGVVEAVRKAVDLLPPAKRRLLFLAAAVQISLGILDLVGIALIGLVAAVGVSGVGAAVSGSPASQTLPGWLMSLLDAVGLGSLSVSQLAVILALAAVLILAFVIACSATISDVFICILSLGSI